MTCYLGNLLGSLISGARIITGGMLQATSECIRDIITEVGAVILRKAVVEDVAEGHGQMSAKELSQLSQMQGYDNLNVAIHSLEDLIVDAGIKIGLTSEVEVGGTDTRASSTVNENEPDDDTKKRKAMEPMSEC